MSFPDITLSQHIPSGRKLMLLLSIVLGTSATIGAIAAQVPLLAVAIVVLVLLIATFIVWPEAPTLVVFSILYTNAAVIAVQFHGVPFIVGASVPLLLIIPLVNYLIFQREKIIVNSVVLLLIPFLVIQSVGVLVAKYPLEAMNNVITFVVEGLGLYFLIINTVRTWKVLRLVVWVLIITGLFLGGLSVYQQVTGTFKNNYGGFAQVSNAAFGTGEETIQGEVTQTRLAGPLGQQNRYAQIMVMLAPLAIIQFLGERSIFLRALAFVAMGFILSGAALTFSRGAAVGFVLMIAVMGFMRYIKLHHFALVLLGLVLLLQVFPQYGARLISLQEITSSVAESGDKGIEQADGATKSRVTEMLAAGLMFIDHPVVGVGPGMYRYHYLDYAPEIGIKAKTTERQPHVLYLGIAAENGALGLICFMMILSLELYNLTIVRKRWLKSRPELAHMATGFILAIFVYAATGIFLHFAFIRYFWLIMGLAGSVSYIANVTASNEVKPGKDVVLASQPYTLRS